MALEGLEVPQGTLAQKRRRERERERETEREEEKKPFQRT